MGRELNSVERKTCYQYLAGLFDYPDQDLLDALDSLLQGLSSLLEKPLPPALQQPADLISLQVAYTDLFINRIGGTPAPPYGSVYLDEVARLMGESSQRVAQAYRAEGLNLDSSNEPPDYLATELEFLFYLLDEELIAQEMGKQQRVAELQQQQTEFFTEFLQPWIEPFTERIGTANGHILYSWGAELLKTFCESESRLLSNQEVAEHTHN